MASFDTVVFGTVWFTGVQLYFAILKIFSLSLVLPKGKSFPNIDDKLSLQYNVHKIPELMQYIKIYNKYICYMYIYIYIYIYMYDMYMLLYYAYRYVWKADIAYVK